MTPGSEISNATLTGLIAGGIALVVALGMLRTAVLRRYPGGPGRYVLALLVQASAFIIPVPLVGVAMITTAVSPYYGTAILTTAPYGSHILAALLVGFTLALGLRLLPWFGPLLNDLARARMEVALERMPPYSSAEA